MVVETNTSYSSAGNEMLNLILHFDVGRDKPLTVYDRLLFIKSCLWKVEKFCAATRHPFDSGEIDENVIRGYVGKAHLDLGEKRDDGKQFTEVKWYIKADGFVEQPPRSKPALPKDQAPDMPPSRPESRGPKAPPADFPPQANDIPPGPDPQDPTSSPTGEDIPF